jgi:hypothetical protein
MRMLYLLWAYSIYEKKLKIHCIQGTTVLYSIRPSVPRTMISINTVIKKFFIVIFTLAQMGPAGKKIARAKNLYSNFFFSGW